MLSLYKIPILWLTEEQAQYNDLGIDLEFEPIIKDVYFTKIDAFYDNGYGNTIVVSGGQEYQCDMSIEDFIKEIGAL